MSEREDVERIATVHFGSLRLDPETGAERDR